MTIVRQIVISPGPYADTNWLDPAVTPPDNARRFRLVGEQLQFALRGRASEAPDAAIVSLGTMTVDAFVALETPGGGVSRDKSVLETEGSSLPGQVLLQSRVYSRGAVGRLHLTLTDVSAPVVEALLLTGGRQL